MPQVSVVIPVYNSERYLSECLDSILNQTLQDIEVICVDDGSTDQSLEILNSYARADARIYTITQDQKGAGAARNLGFRHATGEYVFFCDSDDLCDAELLEKTVARATETQADIVGFDFVRFYEDGSEKQAIGVHLDWLEFDNPEHELPESFNYMNCPDRIMSIVNPTPWNKLYRSAFIRDNNLLFEEISSSNDITFAAVSVATAQIVAYIKEP